MAKLPTAKITAQIASIPDREELLKHVIESLYDQVDKINVMLNNYTHTPTFLHKPRITAFYLDNSRGDGAKFFGLGNVKGYIFTCDDDLIYPEDYTDVMIAKLKEYDNKVILTNHGRIMEDKPVSNSYTDRRGGIRNPDSKFHCLLDTPREAFLDIGGTGVMAWHSDYFLPDYDKITLANMADIWVAKFAHEQGCKILHNPHRGEWIRYASRVLGIDDPHTIWDDHFPNPQAQTDLYNSF